MHASPNRATLTPMRDTAVDEVRDQAARILAALGTTKLRIIAFFRAKKWADVSIRLADRDHGAAEWTRASEWLRIARTLPPAPTPHFTGTTNSPNRRSTTMSGTTNKFTVVPSDTPGLGAYDTDFTTAVAEMVADHAPRLFAVVLEYGEQTDAHIAAWGMALDDGAYMTTTDGKNQYALAEPDNALRYVRSHTNITAHLVWASPSAPHQDE